MTREEALNILHNASVYHPDYLDALNMAIKALEQEPSDDCVSRQAIVEYIKGSEADLGHDLENELVVKDILNMPSVTPTQRWIPVSERLPKEMGTYMTTIDYGEHGLVTGQRYYYGRGLKWNDECVIAWMPLSKPYKAEMESEE